MSAPSEEMASLQPGRIIVPPALGLEAAGRLAARLYGLPPKAHILPLHGYDDKNFHIKDVEWVENPYVNEICTDGYVLKITNSLDSINDSTVEGQNELMIHLGKHAFRAPQPVKNISGKYFSKETLKDELDKESQHLVRLLTFQKGEILKKVKVTSSIAYDLGMYLFQIDDCLKTFSHPYFENNSSIWRLDQTSKLNDFIYIVNDKKRKSMVAGAIERFQVNVMPNYESLSKGILHGDYNEQNILISNDKVSGILDFGDAHYGPYLFELAIGLCYFILHTQSLESAADFVRGYSKMKPLTPLEASLLKDCILARICQSLVLGLYSYSLNPENEYILSTQEAAWKMLPVLTKLTDEKLREMWNI